MTKNLRGSLVWCGWKRGLGCAGTALPLACARAHAPDGHAATGPVPGSADWLRLARIARILSWLTLAWMGVEGGVAIGAAVAAGSVALLGFGLDSGIEAMASVIVIWRFTGTRLVSATSERRAQQLVAVSFFLLAPYIAVEAFRALVAGDRAETSIIGLVLTAGTAVFEPALGVAKRRLGARLGSSATTGEGQQNLLCAYLAIAVFAGLAGNTLFGAWWLDGVVALGIGVWAAVEGRRSWAGKSCGCAGEPGLPC
jgi:divalent metal cation (Fe/Co/Zn/Cd) transporter